jgi:hypothetical protein
VHEHDGFPEDSRNLMIALKTYPPAGLCVYCESVEQLLSREHIIARGLGGRLVLPEASCAQCRKITSEIEFMCLRAILGNVRVHLKYPTCQWSQPTTRSPNRVGGTAFWPPDNRCFFWHARHH